MAQLRSLHDHCPIVLSINEDNWDPKPFNMLKCWADVPGYKQFVSEKWQSFKVNCWGGFVLKEKFKLLKAELKEWHKKHTSNLPGRISSLKECISLLDCKGEGTELVDLEVEELCALFR